MVPGSVPYVSQFSTGEEIEGDNKVKDIPVELSPVLHGGG